MLLATDIGNTGITIGVFDNQKLISTFSIKTNKKSGKEEFLSGLLKVLKNNGIDPSGITGSVVSSVVPELDETVGETLKDISGKEPVIISHTSITNMPILYDDPKEVGADRIVNSVAAYSIFQKSVIVVDFGTATTFDCISGNGEYLGGAIAPGIEISAAALVHCTSKLPTVEIEKPGELIGKNTRDSMKSGIYFGYVSLVDGMVNKISMTMDSSPEVIATGGFSGIISEGSELIKHFDETLTLKGLHILHGLNG